MNEPDGEWLRSTLDLRDEVMRRWLADKRPTDLDELLAVDAELIPALEDHEKVMLLRSQIRQLWDRMSRNGSAGDLAMIIEAARDVCRLACPPANKDLSDLCYFLLLRYERTRDVADLLEAVAAGHRSVRHPSGDPNEQAVHLSNLFGAVLAFAEDAAGSPDAFTEAVRVAERAACLFPADFSVPGADQEALPFGRRARGLPVSRRQPGQHKADGQSHDCLVVALSGHRSAG